MDFDEEQAPPSASRMSPEKTREAFLKACSLLEKEAKEEGSPVLVLRWAEFVVSGIEYFGDMDLSVDVEIIQRARDTFAALERKDLRPSGQLFVSTIQSGLDSFDSNSASYRRTPGNRYHHSLLVSWFISLNMPLLKKELHVTLAAEMLNTLMAVPQLIHAIDSTVAKLGLHDEMVKTGYATLLANGNHLVGRSPYVELDPYMDLVLKNAKMFGELDPLNLNPFSTQSLPHYLYSKHDALEKLGKWDTLKAIQRDFEQVEQIPGRTRRALSFDVAQVVALTHWHPATYAKSSIKPGYQGAPKDSTFLLDYITHMSIMEIEGFSVNAKMTSSVIEMTNSLLADLSETERQQKQHELLSVLLAGNYGTLAMAFKDAFNLDVFTNQAVMPPTQATAKMEADVINAQTTLEERPHSNGLPSFTV